MRQIQFKNGHFRLNFFKGREQIFGLKFEPGPQATLTWGSPQVSYHEPQEASLSCRQCQQPTEMRS
jgi:hypothetical protein